MLVSLALVCGLLAGCGECTDCCHCKCSGSGTWGTCISTTVLQGGCYDCDADCQDTDGYGYGAGADCLGVDCDDTDPDCLEDCSDVDLDGDGYGQGYDCPDRDCRDDDAQCWAVGNACCNTGPATCSESISCASTCDYDAACIQACFEDATAAAQSLLSTLQACMIANDCMPDDVSCISNNCPSQTVACVNGRAPGR